MSTRKNRKTGSATSRRSTAAPKVVEASPAPPAPTVESEKKTPPINVMKQEFSDRVIAAIGGDQSDIKTVIEAVLAQLHTELADGHVLDLPPLGKAMVIKSIEKGMTVWVRNPEAGAA